MVARMSKAILERAVAVPPGLAKDNLPTAGIEDRIRRPKKEPTREEAEANEQREESHSDHQQTSFQIWRNGRTQFAQCAIRERIGASARRATWRPGRELKREERD